MRNLRTGKIINPKGDWEKIYLRKIVKVFIWFNSKDKQIFERCFNSVEDAKIYVIQNHIIKAKWAHLQGVTYMDLYNGGAYHIEGRFRGDDEYHYYCRIIVNYHHGEFETFNYNPIYLGVSYKKPQKYELELSVPVPDRGDWDVLKVVYYTELPHRSEKIRQLKSWLHAQARRLIDKEILKWKN